MFTKEWQTFILMITRQDKLPYWEFLWSEFTKEDLRLSLVDGTMSSIGKGLEVGKEEENVTLEGKGK